MQLDQEKIIYNDESNYGFDGINIESYWWNDLYESIYYVKEKKMKTLAAWRGCRNKECLSEKCEMGDNCPCTTENPCKHCK